MDDREFVAAFEDCTLPAYEFHHRQHVRLAWIYLREQPLLDALARFVEALKRFAAHHGASAKYHETITFAFLFLIHERMHRASHATFDEFAAANEDLFGPVLERYYGAEVLASEFARKTFVLPTVRFDDEPRKTLDHGSRGQRISLSKAVRRGIRLRAEQRGETNTSPNDAIRHLIGRVRGGPKNLSERTGEGFAKIL